MQTISTEEELVYKKSYDSIHCSLDAEIKSKLNIAEEDFLHHDTDSESLDDYYSQNMKTIHIPVKKETRLASNHSTDCEKIKEGMVLTHKTPELLSKDTVRFKSVSFTEDIDKEPTKIIPKRHEKKVNVDDGITDHVYIEININKTPEGILIQEDKPVELSSHDDYKTNEQVFMPSKTVAVEYLPSQIKDVEGLVLNNDKHVKETFEETVNQFKKALQSSIGVKNVDIPTISKDKTDKRKSIDVDNNYYNTTQDNYKDQSDKEKESKVSSVVSSNADDEVVLCCNDKNINYGKDSLRQEKMSAIDVSANVAVLTNELSESSDEEFTKKAKQYTFSDSDLPDSDEIREILLTYPKPTFTEPYSELEEVEDSSQEEIYQFLRHRKNKIVTPALIEIMKLPQRFITRRRNPVERLGISTEVSKTNTVHILKSRYLTEQEDDIDEEIIIENVKRLQAFEKQAKSLTRKNNNNISNEHKETIKVNTEYGRKDAKSKSTSSGRKCVALDKKDAAKARADAVATPGSTHQTITRKTRSMTYDKDNKNTENKCKFQENKIKPKNKKKTSTSPEIEVRRCKRHQTTEPPKPVLKKSTHEQSTVYNISSSSSESPKSLKRSLVDDGDVPSPKRTRSHNTNINNSLNNASLRATPARLMKTQQVLLTAFPSTEVEQNSQGPYVRIVRCELLEKQFKTENRQRNCLKGNTKTHSQTTRPRRLRR